MGSAKYILHQLVHDGKFLQKGWNNVSKNMGDWKSLCEISALVFQVAGTN